MIKSLWNSFKISFSMFSKIPMPQAEWTKENMKYMMCFFPFIGIVIGCVFYGVSAVCIYFNFQSDFTSALLVCIPIVITGGIHFDGLLDTSDAMSSWREKEKRLKILKDSNAGAFAVITACVYFVLWFGAVGQIYQNRTAMQIMSAGFVISRCLSGIGVIIIPKATDNGTVAQFSRNSSDRIVKNILVIYMFIVSGIILYINIAIGIFTIIVAILTFLYYHYKAMKYFGGTTGDLSGCFLCLCETAILLMLAVACGIGGII